MDFVLQKLPMPDGATLTTHIGDARDALAELPAQVMFDVVILDIFSGPEAPPRILPAGNSTRKQQAGFGRMGC